MIPIKEELVCGGGSYVCEKCGKTHFGSTIHYCDEEDIKIETVEKLKQQNEELFKALIFLYKRYENKLLSELHQETLEENIYDKVTAVIEKYKGKSIVEVLYE